MSEAWKCRVTLIANAGLMIECGGKKVLIDPLHDQKTPTFSSVTPAIAERVLTAPEFAEPDIIIVTHKHPDHYSYALMEKELARYPRAELFAPFADFPRTHVLTGDRMEAEAAGVKLHFARFEHEGQRYKNVSNYAVILAFDGWRVLDVADTKTGSEALADWAAEGHTDLAVLMFPWYMLHLARNEVDAVIRPDHIVLTHIPFAADDVEAFRPSIRRQLERHPAAADLRVLTEPFQTEIFP